MATKSFAKAPKPSMNRPSPEAIAQFERGGLGTDQKAPASSEKGRVVEASAPSKRPTPIKKAVQKVEAAEPTKRLSVDISESLHRRFKVACVTNGVNMGAEIQRFLEKRTAQLESN